FSKPDWHNENYWWPYFPPKDRNPNYNPAKYPQRWNQFKDFTYKQIEELMSGYGKMDILWLDGGQVRPDSTVTEEERPWIKVPYPQEINMHRIAAMARKNQPGILMVDRSVYGYYQNYLTPEQQIPDAPLNYPWETCLTMATSWSYVANDTYKSTHQLIHTLVDIVAKGGNLLLNIGPDEKGQWHNDAYMRLKEIGNWMQQNQSCIYSTTVSPPYKSDNICFTKNSKHIFAIYLAKENEPLPEQIEIKNFVPRKNATLKILGCGKATYTIKNNHTYVKLPANYIKPNSHAWVLQFDN
ncbi:MAG TPA: alpha-L-fucosidase, partial [Bacteroidia bacterium]|nr:alpha-L-fucosidase [Bacteroidia bacterium]